jgi:hypothetical protein
MHYALLLGIHGTRVPTLLQLKVRRTMHIYRTHRAFQLYSLTFFGRRGNFYLLFRYTLATWIPVGYVNFDLSLLYKFLFWRNWWSTPISSFFWIPLILKFMQIALPMESSIFWYIAPRNLSKVNRSLRRTFLFHVKAREISQPINRHETGSKHWFYAVMSHENIKS